MDWSRRHFLLGTVIGLGAGGVALSETTTEIRTVEEDDDDGEGGTLIWQTADDWDNAEDEKLVVHEDFLDLPGDGTIQLGYPSFDETGNDALLSYYPHSDDGPDITDVTGNWPDATEDGSPNSYGNAGPFGQDAVDYDSNQNFTINEPSDLPVNDDEHTIVVLFNVPNPYKEQFTFWGNEEDDEARGFRSQDDDLKGYFWANDHDENVGFASDEWVMVAWTYDGSESRIYHNGSFVGDYDAGSLNTASTDVYFGERPGEYDDLDGLMGAVRIYGRALSDSEISDLWGTSGHLETATKSFPSPVQPDITDATYSQNGESIELEVIGSPGESDEETVTQTLDGATSYTLSWGSGHTDFRVKINLDTSDVTVSPTVDSIGLVA